MMTMIQTLLLNIGINVEINAEDEALVQTDSLDPTKWDLLITNAGGGCQIGEWNRFTNYNEFGTDYNMAYIHDDTLRITWLPVYTGWPYYENMNAMHDYILENGN